ncbi:MAG: CBS domain-containing protein [Pseudomonadales bacterium]
MLNKIHVKDYMARHLVTLKPDDEVLRAIHTLIEHKIAGAPVVDKDGKLVGILTEKDCMKAAVDASYHSQYGGLVVDFMSTEVEVMDVEDSIIEAAKRFLNKSYRRYPVMDNNRLVGQISSADVIRALGDLWQW